MGPRTYRDRRPARQVCGPSREPCPPAAVIAADDQAPMGLRIVIAPSRCRRMGESALAVDRYLANAAQRAVSGRHPIGQPMDLRGTAPAGLAIHRVPDHIKDAFVADRSPSDWLWQRRRPIARASCVTPA